MIDYSMLKKERKEHPTLSEATVKTIVEDHMKEESQTISEYVFKRLKQK